MDILQIGKNIACLRKQKGVKQDELAKFVGVSAQAVSKWENGGVPDTELLSKIADYFSVSIDVLFGRKIDDCINIEDAVVSDLSKVDDEQRFTRAFELCWIIEQALFGKMFSNTETIWKESCEFKSDDEIYSNVLKDNGYTEMGLFNRIKYFLLVPDAVDKEKAFFAV